MVNKYKVPRDVKFNIKCTCGNRESQYMNAIVQSVIMFNGSFKFYNRFKDMTTGGLTDTSVLAYLISNVRATCTPTLFFIQVTCFISGDAVVLTLKNPV